MITCPQCGEQGEQIVWDSINVDLDPETKERIFNEDIFSWTCPHCGLKALAPFGTLYHNMKQKVMIYYLPQRQGDSMGFSLNTGYFPLRDGYTYRSVYDLYDFKEKIRILEAGLKDAAIELMKYMFLHDNRPKGLPDNVNLRFIGVVPKIEADSSKKKILFKCIAPGKGDVGMLPASYKIYEDMVADGIGEQLFPLDADFPEVSQYVMEQLTKN